MKTKKIKIKRERRNGAEIAMSIFLLLVAVACSYLSFMSYGDSLFGTMMLSTFSGILFFISIMSFAVADKEEYWEEVEIQCDVKGGK